MGLSITNLHKFYQFPVRVIKELVLFDLIRTVKKSTDNQTMTAKRGDQIILYPFLNMMQLFTKFWTEIMSATLY